MSERVPDTEAKPSSRVVVRHTGTTTLDAASADVPPTPQIGAGGSVSGRRAAQTSVDVPPTRSVRFDDVMARACRLLQWADEETQYLRTHDVGLFSPDDVRGRNGFADEGLYKLVPRLLNDAAALRLHCGRGVLWDEVRETTERAACAVQAYYRLWTTLRDGR